MVNGLRSNLAFGATFPRSCGIFWDGAALARAGDGPRWMFLVSTVAPFGSLVRDLPRERVHLRGEGGGRRLYSNHP